MNRRALARILSTTPASPYEGVNGLTYSLRNVFGNWTNAVIKIRRSSDNSQAWVFFDGDELTLSSLISTSSRTTPDATTLGTWVSTDSAFVSEWLPLKIDNVLDLIAPIQNTNSVQPRFINSGVIDLKNGKSCLTFSGGQELSISTVVSYLESSGECTIFSVNSNNDTSFVGTVYNTTTTGSIRLNMLNDNRSSGTTRLLLVQTSGGVFAANTLAPNSTTNQKLLAATHNGTAKEITSRLDGVFQESDTYTSVYATNCIKFGRAHASNLPLTGTIQEVMLFENVLTNPKIVGIETEIIAHYGI